MLSSFQGFAIARLPRIHFGSGVFSDIPRCIASHGRHVLLVTGANSFPSSRHWEQLEAAFAEMEFVWHSVNVVGEPSPELVDRTVQRFLHEPIDVVLGIGGGSALDAAKAIAGLLRVGDSVMDYLEGVGPEREYIGPAVPFIAVPTTAGTGSEATKNAVLSRSGTDGFKKSFRDDQLVAEHAFVDPDLLATCPPTVIAANGMDALTQLIESYVSLKANPFNDALGVSGLRAARDGLLPLYDSGGEDADARDRMAYASLLSGINLAQTGLGSVHGLAAPMGAFYPIPHGVVCGTLLAAATERNILSMLEREPENPALDRYARVSEILWRKRWREKGLAWEKLIELLTDWTAHLRLPRLSAFGVKRDGLAHVINHSRGSSMRTNPIRLLDDEIRQVLEKRL